MTAEDLLSPGQHPGIEVPAKPGLAQVVHHLKGGDEIRYAAAHQLWRPRKLLQTANTGRIDSITFASNGAHLIYTLMI